jgi:hypothetical protein
MSLLFIRHPRETDLALFAGGELGPLSRWRIERHLQACGECQEAVAGFFHLQSELSGLADLPLLDWNALANSIEARVRVEVPREEPASPRWLHRPSVWQVGLASATLLCAIAIVRQWPGDQEDSASPVALSQAREASSPSTPRSPGVDRVEPSGAESAVPPDADQPDALAEAPLVFRDGAAEEGLNREAEADLATSASGSSRQQQQAQFADANASRANAPPSQTPRAPDISAQTPPGAEGVRKAPAQKGAEERLESEDRLTAASALSLGQDVAEPAAGGDRARGAEEAPAEAQRRAAGPTAVLRTADESASSSRADRPAVVVTGALNESPAPAKKAEAQETPPGRRVALAAEYRAPARDARQEAELENTAVWPLQRGFTMLPAALDDPGVDVAVAADGWISIRTIDSRTGTITITDVY